MSAFISPQPLVGNSEVTDYQPKSDQPEVNGNDQMEIWLKSLGLRFNPFSALNAADDPHLSEYLIELEVFETIWGDWISFVFEPAGGGKTALRVRTSQACWSTQDINRPFPIPYNPPFLKWGTVMPTYQHHVEALTLVGAEQLFLSLSHRPEWLLSLNPAIQQKAGEVLAWSLSVESLKYYLDELRETGNLEALKRELDPTFKIADPPDPATLKRFCDVLDQRLETTTAPPANPSTQWDALCELLLHDLRFPSIYILLDGLDATIETTTDPQLALSSLKPLLSLLFDWAERRIFLKGFLPLDTRPAIQAHHPHLFAQARVASIDWDAEKLAKLVCQRVFVASAGKFSSLDAIVTPSLRDFEDILVESVIAPRPRELLTLINDVFSAHLRQRGNTGKIEESDWKAGLSAYQRDAVQ
jgi:hypothetical protein